MYNENDITWSSIEKHYPYNKVTWHVEKNGIPSFKLYDKVGRKIDIVIAVVD